MFRLVLTINCLAIFVAYIETADAQLAAPDSESSADVEVIHDELRALRDGIIQAIDAKDAEAVLSFLHEDVVLTAQSGAELHAIRKHDGVRKYLDDMLTGPDPGVKQLKLDLDVDELTILHGEDTGIAFGSSDDHYVLNEGGEFDLATRWSAAVIKEDDTWEIASLHVSSNLFENPVLTAAKKLIYTVSGIAAVVGMVLGFAVAKFTSRN